jgi:hypothetical protein
MTDLLKCYYSLVQYCPDSSRLEAVNIGVVLACPGREFADIQVARGNDRVRRFFGRDGVDLPNLNAAKEALRNRIHQSRPALWSEEGLSRFAASRGNDLTLTPPRPMRAESPDEALQRLFDELVGGRRQTGMVHANKILELEQMMSHADIVNRVQRHPKVSVPVVNLHMHADYSFRNGRLNLVREQVFRTQPLASAMRIAIEGDLLYTHALPDEGKAQLIVVHDFAGSAGDDRSRIVSLFEEYNVRQFNVTEIDQLRREILATAH